MALRLYNTLTRTKQDFVPIDPSNVRMYVCGPTVYDFAHIGNARPVIVFDVLFRLLRHLYGPEHVTYVRNITDVDDKINARAAEEYPDLPLNEAIRRVTEKTERQFHEDVAALGCLPPTREPRATEYISRPDAPEDMIRLIQRLVDTRHAYVEQGHVLFDVPSMPDYGRLSNRSLDEMIAGARVDIAPYKRDAMDFVLWKPSKPGEPAWPSPWGLGRPGWHIECSAMAGALLGPVFDIHGGGIDLVFPHHENELAQSRCAHGTEVMARYWLHNGFLQVEGEKMSKSLGNFVTIRELLDSTRFGGSRSGDVIRFAMLQTKYAQPINWTISLLEQAEARLLRWKRFAADRTYRRASKKTFEEFIELLKDDLNTPEAFAFVDRIVSGELNRQTDKYTVIKILHFLGITGIRTKLDKISSETIRAARALTKIDGSEWRNIFLSVSQTPHFASGKIKPETRLIAALESILAQYGRERPQTLDLTEDILELAPRVSIDEKEEEIERYISARAAARKAKNFAEADRIRAELDAMGIALKDAKDPKTGELVTTWEVKR